MNDILVSFNIVSLFTRVSDGDSLNLHSQQFDEGNVRLFHHILTSSFFCFNISTNRQTGVAMGSLLSPVFAKFFMEDWRDDTQGGLQAHILIPLHGWHICVLVPWTHKTKEIP